KLDYSIAPIVNSDNISVSGATGDQGVYVLGDDIVVEWDNSAEGDNNPDVLLVNCNLEAFGGDVQTKMFDENNNNIYICRYELSQGINAIANIFVTATNFCGVTTRDGHILSVDTTGKVAEGEEEAETKEKEAKSLGKRYTIKFGDDEAEIGDFSTVDFKPHAKMKRWGEECYLSIEYPETDISKENKSVGLKGKKIEWDSSELGAHFYKKHSEKVYKENSQGQQQEFTINENGGLEFELILKEIPTVNIFSFSIQSKGLMFYYQPELTQEEIDQGAVRPDEIVGSYAVYHESKKNNQYKTGKAFHVYRPKIIDANEDWIWGELEVVTSYKSQATSQEGTLTITVDKDWL
ncbi:MAG: hypothetical protein KAJ14_03265, partial [Candidatus Omnitrophica bacterium]|nr:hypothetical protein [Candidatus Omnitrophota bacterium]